MTKKNGVDYFVVGSGVLKSDVDFALKVVNNSECFRVVRKNGITSKFYSFNHQIVRLDFSCRCSVLENVIIC